MDYKKTNEMKKIKNDWRNRPQFNIVRPFASLHANITAKGVLEKRANKFISSLSESEKLFLEMK